MTRFPYNKPSQATTQKLVVPASLPSRQSGISLIEAMISLLLIAVTAVGLAYVSSRSMLTQRYVTTQNLAVIQMREHLKANEDGEIELKVNEDGEIELKASSSISPNPTEISSIKIGNIDDSVITGISIDLRDISTNDTGLFGGEIKIGSTQ